MSELRVLAAQELPDGAMKVVEADGVKILLIHHNGRLCAVQRECPHAGAPLEEGGVSNGRLICPWHLGTFALPGGELVEPPAMDNLKSYAVRSDGQSIFVEAEARTTPAKLKGRAANELVILLAGAGAAGAMAAKTLRQCGFTGRIVAADPVRDEPVDRTQLSKDALGGNVALDEIRLDVFADLDVERRYAAVTEISLRKKEARLDDGTVIPFDKALVATGGRPKRLSVPGGERAFTIRHSEDARRILQLATGGKRVVIAGTSFIAMEAASALVQKGLQVTVVGRETLPFAKQFGSEVAGVVKKWHEGGGTRFESGAEIAAVSEHGVTIRDESGKRELPAELVIFGVGVSPDLGFAHEFVLARDGGVVTDESLRVSDSVWVAGDIASVNGRRIEHWRVAQQHGRAAALAMMGQKACYQGVPYFWTYHFGRRLGYLGHASEWDETVIHGDLEGGEFMVFYLQGKRVKAVLNCGMETQMAALSEPMRGELTVDDAPVRNIIHGQ